MLIMVLKGDTFYPDLSSVVKSFNLIPGEPIPCEGDDIRVSSTQETLKVRKVLKDYRQVDQYDIDQDSRGQVTVYVFV